LINDAHCHFFSDAFFAALGRRPPPLAEQPAAEVIRVLGWDPPGPAEELADRIDRELAGE